MECLICYCFLTTLSSQVGVVVVCETMQKKRWKIGSPNFFFYFASHQVKIWFQNRRMKWKRSRKSKEQAALNSPLTDMSMDVHGMKPQNDSHSSSLEDEEEFEREGKDEKNEMGALRAGSLAPVGFLRNGTLNYDSYSEDELEEGGAQARTGVLA